MDPRHPALKPGLIVHPDRSFNAEAPVHRLDDALTPLERVFVRNNGGLPVPDRSPGSWQVSIDGEVERPFTLTVDDLRRRFSSFEITTVMECAGNGRSGFSPVTDGIPWGHGAVACLRFRGIRMADLLAEAGLRSSAVYVAHESPDRTAEGKPALSRGLPLAKALAPETLVAFEANGEPLPLLHGGPLRVVAPGFPGSAWQKWLTRIWVRDREHDGARMTGLDYRLPDLPVSPDETPDPARFHVIERMGPRALLTSHADGSVVPGGAPTVLGGWAFGHGVPVESVMVSLDGGVAWRPATLGDAPDSPFGWRRFSIAFSPAAAGPLMVMPRAILADGTVQPVVESAWNPKGYCNNACQRLELVAA
jgi:sulfite oxidase